MPFKCLGKSVFILNFPIWPEPWSLPCLFLECPHSSSFLQRSEVYQGNPTPEVSKSAGAQLKAALALLRGTNTFSIGFCARQAPPPRCLKANRVPVGLLSLVAVLVPIIPIVSLCPFHIFHGLNSVHNAAHRPGLCVTQYLLLANVRSAPAFKTSDAINELSCIDSCRFLKNLSLSFIFCACFFMVECCLGFVSGWVMWLPENTWNLGLGQTFKQRLRIVSENLMFCEHGVRAKRTFID